jgi:hypothetical protein
MKLTILTILTILTYLTSKNDTSEETSTNSLTKPISPKEIILTKPISPKETTIHSELSIWNSEFNTLTSQDIYSDGNNIFDELDRPIIISLGKNDKPILTKNAVISQSGIYFIDELEVGQTIDNKIIFSENHTFIPYSKKNNVLPLNFSEDL